MEQPEHLTLKGFLAFQILYELQREELCGDDLARIIGQKKGSKLTPGTIYPALKFLRRKKLIHQKRDGRKKLYALTPMGTEEYRLFRKNFKKIFRGLL